MIYPLNVEPSLPAHKTKRKRGGQKGNQNARKHGFYSALSPAEICEFWHILNTQRLEPEIAALRLKLRSLLQHDPANRRALREASKLLAKWYAAKYRLDSTDEKLLKNAVWYTLTDRQPGIAVDESTKRIERILTDCLIGFMADSCSKKAFCLTKYFGVLQDESP